MTRFTVGLLYPQQGPAGLFGPSCLACAMLAASDINGRGGVLGREVVLRPIDAAAGLPRVAREVDGLIAAGTVDAVLGWHTSDVRRAVANRIRGRIPYIYTALYEGGESTAGVFLTGETPDVQILPAMRWLGRERSVTDWYIVGSDYLWAQDSARACRRYAAALGQRVRRVRMVPLRTEDFSAVIADIVRSRANGVLMLLLGQDAVMFNRAFAAAGLASGMTRFAPLMDEHMLLGSGPDATGDLFTSSGYFGSIITPENMAFGSRYFSRYGVDAAAPSSVGESCFEGMLLLESLVRTAGTVDLREILYRAPQVRYDGARGSMALCNGHTRQVMYLARAVDCDLEVIDRL
jgi:urea transport system substrate-binding protein